MYSTLIIWNTVHTWLFVVVRSKVDGLSSCDHAIFHDIIDTGLYRVHLSNRQKNCSCLISCAIHIFTRHMRRVIAHLQGYVPWPNLALHDSRLKS
jgi:hypothetical protein